jgi:hypothetical protein
LSSAPHPSVVERATLAQVAALDEAPLPQPLLPSASRELGAV